MSELRLRVEGSFTATELRELARKWGLAPEPTWDRGTSDLVRGLLRDAEKMFGMTELTRRLRVEKPLVEWPEVESNDAEKWGPKSVTQLGLAPPPSSSTLAVGSFASGKYLDDATEVRAPDLGALEVTIEAAAPPTAESALLPQADAAPANELHEPTPASSAAPLSRAPASVAGPASQTGPASSAPASIPPSSGVRPLAPFPGTVTPVPVRNGIDPKVLIVVASLMLGLAVVAFGAGLLWSRRGSEPEATKAQAKNAGPSSAPIIHTNGAAGRALQIFDDALLGVASRCEIDVEGDPSSDILAVAQEGCSKAIRSSRRRVSDPDLPDSPDNPRPRPRTTADSDDPRPVRTPSLTLPGRPSCITSCAGQKGDCMSNCGAEPNDTSKFDVWQACSGRCVAAESRCRLSCR